MNAPQYWAVVGVLMLFAFAVGVFWGEKRRRPRRLALIDEHAEDAADLIDHYDALRRELQRSDEALRRQRLWAENLIESIVEGVVTLDRHGRITSFSRGAERITGWKRPEAVGASAGVIFRTPPEAASFWQQIPPAGGEHKIDIFDRQGKRLTLSVTGARLASTDGDPAQVALVLRDVTEEESAIRATNKLLANVSHEFRTPLSALAASVELLRSSDPPLVPAEQERLLLSLQRGTLRLQSMVDNLLDSMSIQAGRFRVAPEPLALAPVIADAVHFMEPLFRQKGQPVQWRVPADLPMVQGDARRLAQVLHNLLSNASKYGPPGQPVSVRAEMRSGKVWVGVTDRGAGIAPEAQESLFRRFGRLDDNDENSTGIGLGLAIVKEIILRHGGEVGVDSQSGAGATFWFTLPPAEMDVRS